jgi:SAM-dependent methyltransferase
VLNITGERPVEKVTPDSVIAIHDAGYREVEKRLGSGIVVDLGSGEGFETAKLIGPHRTVIGIDYDQQAGSSAMSKWGSRGLLMGRMDCSKLGFKTGSVDYACSSHIIEHFSEPALHVAEMARILKSKGTGFFLTPNKPTDFENPFHVYLFDAEDLRRLLSLHFRDVWVGALDCSQQVKDEIAQRRKKAQKIYDLDIFDLRHKMPKKLWITFYSRLLPIGQQVIYRKSMGGSTGIDDSHFFVSESVDDTMPILFAVAKDPIHSAV